MGPEAINGKSLQGNIGSTFLITLGDRLFIDCNLENGGGFPSQPEEGLPANITWLRNGEPFNQTLLDNVHSSQLCFDALSLSFGGTIECIATSRLSSDGSFLVDRATSEVTILSEKIMTTLYIQCTYSVQYSVYNIIWCTIFSIQYYMVYNIQYIILYGVQYSVYNIIWCTIHCTLTV